MSTKKAGAEAPTKRHPKNTPKAQVLSILRKNKKGITRPELVKLLNMDDRSIREYIGKLREEGYKIGNAPEGGYTIDRKRDFERAVAFYDAKLKKEAQRVKRMKKTLETWDNVKMNF